MQDLIGTTLGHYRIVEKIGEGGMGEVYRAQDERLDRDVAIKVLPASVAQDPERIARFEREAKLLASLSHQNVATLHGLEEHDGQRFLVMELAEGETLADRIKKGPIVVEDALEIARQIAEGLEAAHEQGIIHRDLKPANVMASPEGEVKVLDFGLAKAWHPDESDADLTHSPTLTGQMTAAGVLLGTAAYMSPEQARGKKVDKRADIWAFGVILFEMLTSVRLFDGETTSDILAAVLRAEPDWNALPATTPWRVRDVLRRCLERDPSRRLRDIGDARLEMLEASLEPAPGAAERRRPRRNLIAWAIAAVATGAAVTLGILGWSGRASRVEPTVTHVLPPDDSVSCFRDGFAVSPDGRRIAFVSLSSRGERLIWVRSLDRADPVLLAGTDGASYPFWSPDGREIAFYAGGKLRRIAAQGGPVQTICRAGLGGFGGSWGSAGSILFGDALGGVSRVAVGGEPEPVPLDGGDFPFFLPDGRQFLYRNLLGSRRAAFLGSLDDPTLRREIQGIPDSFHVEWAPPDRLLYHRRSDRTLLTQRVDLARARVTGRPEILAENIPTPSGTAPLSVSPAGVAAFLESTDAGSEAGAGRGIRMLWVDRRGGVVRDLGQERSYWWAEISHDGRRIAVNPDEQVWIYDAAGTTPPQRLTSETSEGGDAHWPLWSPRGDAILAHVFIENKYVLREIPLSGGQARELFRDTYILPLATDWTRDGRLVAITRNDLVSPDLAYLDLENDTIHPYLETAANERGGQFSPDGRWIAYESDEAGAFDIYLRSFPEPGEATRVSEGGGMHPRWREDGRELFYLTPDWTVMAAEMKFEPSPEVVKRTPLFQMVMEDVLVGLSSPYDAAPDGQHFVVLVPAEPPTPLTVVQNWTALLEK
jgi:serine/threonine protein kinase